MTSYKGATELTFHSVCDWRWEHIWQFGGSLRDEARRVGECWHDVHKRRVNMPVSCLGAETNVPYMSKKGKKEWARKPYSIPLCFMNGASSFLSLIIPLCFGNTAAAVVPIKHGGLWIGHTRTQSETDRERRKICVEQLCLGNFLLIIAGSKVKGDATAVLRLKV